MKLLAFIVFMTALIWHSAANAQTPHWHAERFTMSVDKKGKAAADYVYSGVWVSSVNPDEPEIKFGCSERHGLTATITFLPASKSDSRKSERVRPRTRTTKLSIEGRKAEFVPWVVVKETRMIQTRRNKHAAMIYNAVVRQVPFTIKEPYNTTVTITPPNTDDNFKFFVENCVVTSG